VGSVSKNLTVPEAERVEFKCPRKVRGALVAGYQFCITLGLLIASCVDYGTENLSNTASYRIPIAIQFAWGLILGGGLLFLPDSPRYFVKRGRVEKARESLVRLRGQPPGSEYIEAELAEIVVNEEYERSLIPSTGWFSSWANCFKGSLWNQGSNVRKTILGTSLQMMQQWTGVNFIFYYSTPFLQSTGAIKNTFLISLIFTLVNVCSTPISFYTVERFGRRPLLIFGALGMLICQFLVAIIGVTIGFNHTHTDAAGKSIANNISAVNAQIAFIAIFIFFFASTWGPGAWVRTLLDGSFYAAQVLIRNRSSLEKFSRFPFVPVVLAYPPPRIGCGTPYGPPFLLLNVTLVLLTVPRSSPSSRRTWLILTRLTCVLRSSSSGGVSARARLYTHTSLCPRQRYVLSLFWRTTCS
jgi:MFS family permease